MGTAATMRAIDRVLQFGAPPRIVVIGYSGAGKSTLAVALAERYGIPVLHLDQVHFAAGWVERCREDELALVEGFLDQHGAWVIDGDYEGLCFERRLVEASCIVFLDVPRIVCFARAFRRWLAYRGSVRPDMASGCIESFDAEFMRWLLADGRTPGRRARFEAVCRRFPEKIVRVHW